MVAANFIDNSYQKGGIWRTNTQDFSFKNVLLWNIKDKREIFTPLFNWPINWDNQPS